MAGPLPHSAQIQADGESFLAEVLFEVGISSKALRKSNSFRQVYRVSLAIRAVLDELIQASTRPPSTTTRGITALIPLLVSVRQLGAARIELRRFIELVMLDVYFSDHLVEWKRFTVDPAKGFVREQDDPIEYCAHRELAYYLNYAKSLLRDEPSGLAPQAVDTLRMLVGELNAAVHPGAAVLSATTVIPLDAIDERTLGGFSNLWRSVAANVSIVLAGVYGTRFDMLPAMTRAHFDWLIERRTAKQLRSGPFGLHRAGTP